MKRTAALAALAGAALLAPPPAALADDAPRPSATAGVFFRDPDRDTARRIEDLISQFSTDSVESRRRSRQALQAFGFWSVDPLITAARERESPVRCSAVLTLDAIQDRRAVGALRDLVQTSDGGSYCAAFAALALGRFRDGPAERAFREALRNPAPNQELLRPAAPLALAKLRTPEALALLRDQMKDTGASEAAVSARLLAIGFFPDAALTLTGDAPSPLLEAGLSSRRKSERQAALLGFLVAISRTSRGKEYLAKRADDPAEHPGVVAVALLGLVAFEDQDVTDRLVRVASSPAAPDSLREYACDLLVARAGPAAVPALRHILQTPQTPRLRASALLVLGGIDSDDAREAIVNRIRDPAPLVRAAAVVAVARSGSQALRDAALPRIDARLREGDSDSRVREVFTLARAVLTGERADVVWPAVSNDGIFSRVRLTQRQRLLEALNRRAELCLDLGKITNFQTEAQIVPEGPQSALERSESVGGAGGDGAGSSPPAPTSPTVLTPPVGQMGSTRTSDWQELRDLHDELSRRPYFTLDDLPVPAAARTGDGK